MYVKSAIISLDVTFFFFNAICFRGIVKTGRQRLIFRVKF